MAKTLARSTTLKLIHGCESLTFHTTLHATPLQSSMTRYSFLRNVILQEPYISMEKNGSFIREFRISPQVIQDLSKTCFNFSYI
jgi:hypothetical protein